MGTTPRELARTLLARHAERLRLDAAARARVLEGACAELGRLICGGRVARAWLIGSVAWGAFVVRSDVDVVVDGLSPEALAEVRLQLERALGREVDLLRFEELPADFRDRVLREGRALHA